MGRLTIDATFVMLDDVRAGSLLVDGGRITDISLPTYRRSGNVYDGTVDLTGLLVTPGLIDLHVHGGGGGSFEGTAADIQTAIDFHLRHGTTTMLASLVSAPVEQLARSTATLKPFVESGALAGVHLEGPCLNRARCGAQPIAALVSPAEWDSGPALAQGSPVRVVTIAPEVDGAFDLIERLRSHGVVVALGHTDATADTARRAIDAGATLATHLFNGMAPAHHRDVGAAIAALLDDRVTCELIVDRHHLADETVALAFRVAGRNRIALVTDAIAAAGTHLESSDLGGQQVEIVGDAAWLTNGSSLAGSMLSMDASVRNAVMYSGISLVDAVHAATSSPARVLGMGSDVGSIVVGARADLCVWDPDLNLLGVMQHGSWVVEPPAPRIAHRTGD